MATPAFYTTSHFDKDCLVRIIRFTLILLALLIVSPTAIAQAPPGDPVSSFVVQPGEEEQISIAVLDIQGGALGAGGAQPGHDRAHPTL